MATVRGSKGCVGSCSILHGCTMSRVPPVIEDEHDGYCISTAEWSADVRAAVTVRQYWIRRYRVVLPGAPLVYLCLKSRDAVTRISTGRTPSPRLQLERTPPKTGAVR